MDRHTGTAKGTTYSKAVTHKEVLSWYRSATAGDEFRAYKGLYLRRTASGAQWVFRFLSPVTGKQTRTYLWADDPQGLVEFPDASLEDAKGRAAALRAVVNGGADPVIQAERRRQEEETARAAAEAQQRRLAEEAERAALAAERRITVRALFEQWQRAELAPHVLADGTRTGRKDGGEWVKASFERRLFPKLGASAAEDVRRAELLSILDDCKAGGHRRTANVMLADLRQMFRFAAERELVARNPLEGIKRASIGGKDVERDRVLSDAELKTLWAAVPAAGLSPRSAAAIWLILATACRVGEAMAARWEHITLERDDDGQLVSGAWYLPTTKNERDHTIHLSGFALRQVEALLALRELAPDANGDTTKLVPWVFPNTARAGPVDIKSFGKQLADRQRKPDQRLKHRSKNTLALAMADGKWTAHDLRRTAATVMARCRISTDVIDECLNHKLQSKVARVYIKDRRLEEQASAFDALGNWLTTLFEGQASNVVALPARAA